MKKLILIFVFTLLLTGCLNKNIEVTTYQEVIQDDKVMFDGISYDIQSIITKTLTYDKNENRKKEQLYIEGDLYSTSYYDYKDDLLIRVKKIHENGLDFTSEHTYEDGIIRSSFIASDEQMSMTSTSYMDENDRLLKTEIMEDDVVTITNNYHYEEDELKKILSNYDGKLNTTQYFEYNSIGDVIVHHTIYHDYDGYILVEFFDYEYNDDMLPKTITISWIRSQREDFSVTPY